MSAALPPANFLRLAPYYSLLYLYHGVTTVRSTVDPDGSAAAALEIGASKRLFPTPRVFPCIQYPLKMRLKDGSELQSASINPVEFVKGTKARGINCIKVTEKVGSLSAVISVAKAESVQVMGPCRVPASDGDTECAPEVESFAGVAQPLKLNQTWILSRLGDWEQVSEERVNQIAEFCRQQSVVNTPSLNSHRMLLNPSEDTQQQLSEHPVARLLPRVLFRHLRETSSRIHQNQNGTILQGSFNMKVSIARELHRRGCSILAGSSISPALSVPGLSLIQEASLLHQIIGFSEEQTLEVLTSRGGAHLAQHLPAGDPAKRLGYIEPSAPADILLFARAPSFAVSLGDLDLKFNSTASLPFAVVKDGCLFLRSMMESRLLPWREKFDSWVWNVGSEMAYQLGILTPSDEI